MESGDPVSVGVHSCSQRTPALRETVQQPARWGTVMALASSVLCMEPALLSMAFLLILSLLPGHESLIPDGDQDTPHGWHELTASLYGLPTAVCLMQQHRSVHSSEQNACREDTQGF